MIIIDDRNAMTCAHLGSAQPARADNPDDRIRQQPMAATAHGRSLDGPYSGSLPSKIPKCGWPQQPDTFRQRFHTTKTQSRRNRV
jgi:hypothetical protein